MLSCCILSYPVVSYLILLLSVLYQNTSRSGRGWQRQVVMGAVGGEVADAFRVGRRHQSVQKFQSVEVMDERAPLQYNHQPGGRHTCQVVRGYTCCLVTVAEDNRYTVSSFLYMLNSYT
jgi:hypothetical protein